MRWWQELKYLARRIDRRRAEKELDEEIRAHLEFEIEENVAAGMSREEARYAALRAFGNVALSQEDSRSVWGFRTIEMLWQDLRYGLRMLARNRGFTVVAVIALAVGIGANSAIFSVVNTVLLRPLPYTDPDRLVMVWEEGTPDGFPINSASAANYIDWRDQNQVFTDAAVIGRVTFNLTGAGEPERLDGRRVSANLFPLLGVQPHVGRTFSAEEDGPGANRVVMLSHALWQRRFGAQPDIVGKHLTLSGETYEVVGVMPPQFQFPSRNDQLWVPIAFTPQQAANRGNNSFEVLARLKPGVTREQAEAEMDAIAARLQQQYPDVVKSKGCVVIPLHEQLVGDIKPALLILLGAVGFVLLVACANVANLLLARAAARHKEIALRLALGARRGRIVRQLMTESLLLSAMGGVVGLLLAIAGVSLLKTFIPDNTSQVTAVNVDANVLAFTLGVSLLTGLIFGLAPALQASRFNLNEALKEGGRDSSAGGHGSHIRSLLVIAEVAVSLVLLIGAGLLIHSFVRLRSVDPGFRTDNLLTMRIALPKLKYPDHATRTAFHDELLRRVTAVPGVRSAAVTNWIPLTLQGDTFGVTVEGRPDPGAQNMPDVVTRVVSFDYLNTMGIQLLRGRPFDHQQDKVDSPPVAIISETTARRLWPDEDPLGKRLKAGGADSDEPWIAVIGVAEDVRQFQLTAEPRLQMYLPSVQPAFFVPGHLVVRTDIDPMSLAGAVRQAVWEIDKDQPVSDVRSMDEIFAESIAHQRFSMLMLGVFAAVAMLLGTVGIYGVVSYTVAQRTHEIGVRMALGAGTGNVLSLIVGHALKLTLIGVLVGLPVAFVLSRLTESLLFGVTPTDPATFVAIPLMLIAAAALASYLPARRATRIDPVIALRYE
ncbi:MAG TPA: ABC transporter permease [Pyrinomonadaceae bacterium]|nr:ABC transporter permease [Pyrinomonadaceae bacterium]